MALRESGEDYLESIYVLSERQGVVRSIDVAEYLGVTKASVSKAMATLENSGYVTSYQAEANGRTRKYYRLTQSGRKELDRETAAWQAYSHGINSVLGFVPG